MPLGHIAEMLGGGGHERVGSIALTAGGASRAAAVLTRFVQEIRSREAEKSRERPARHTGGTRGRPS